MSLPSMKLLLNALREPRFMAVLTLGEWDLLIRQARPADLLARLAALAQQAGVWNSLLSAPRTHLASAQRLAQRQHVELRHEASHAAQPLSPLAGC